jgi:hypothetical protein
MADEIVWVSRAPMDSTLSKTVKGNGGAATAVADARSQVTHRGG